MFGYFWVEIYFFRGSNTLKDPENKSQRVSITSLDSQTVPDPVRQDPVRQVSLLRKTSAKKC